MNLRLGFSLYSSLFSAKYGKVRFFCQALPAFKGRFFTVGRGPVLRDRCMARDRPSPYGERGVFFVVRGPVPRDCSLPASCFSVAAGMARDRFSHRPPGVDTVDKADFYVRLPHSSGSCLNERLKQLRAVLAQRALLEHPFRMILHTEHERLRWILYRLNDAI